jgi:hypothetical protein
MFTVIWFTYWLGLAGIGVVTCARHSIHEGCQFTYQSPRWSRELQPLFMGMTQHRRSTGVFCWHYAKELE